MSTLIGFVQSVHEAKDVVHGLQEVGYQQGEISVLVKNNTAVGLQEGEKVIPAGVASGATTGGALGALGGVLVGLGVIAFPGIGALLVGGPLLAAMGISGAAASTVTGAVAGAVVGGAAGGIIGAFMKAGISEERAREYERRLNEGAALVGVVTDRITDAIALQVFQSHHVSDIAKLP
ncbi:hypothetical protein C5B42_04675 [Candidatus Cerribacteria bacterium 'Amazon FNV 2010 28 9']|uniref:DUF3341 domain-containing protein n=1 Tax=Candidatus Cerribacteria bacterium 'Amazon FNV 2010 28 9' TaxID=2081795 RepID=A0A317JP12_9BACT|nr:MAG: hypothetical protein C5B42_04675 [Candidatus Cerribacteria bacterium 'Amazon FNV 2010 28 9']